MKKEEKEFYKNYKFDLWDMIKKNIIQLLCLITVYILGGRLIGYIDKLQEPILIIISILFIVYGVVTSINRIVGRCNFEPKYKYIGNKK